MAYPFPTNTPTPIFGFITSTIPSPTTSSVYRHTETGIPDLDADKNLLDRLASGAKAAVIVGMVLGIVFIVLFSSWFCCGCCGIRSKQRGMAPDGTRRTPSNIPSPVPATGGSLPLHTIQNRSPPGGYIPPAEPAPPSYEEVVLPRNQAPPRGMVAHNRMSEHDGMVADGKTPLSEIVFEDVDLDRPHTGGSSSQTFEQRHHGAGGDTRGHTNS